MKKTQSEKKAGTYRSTRWQNAAVGILESTRMVVISLLFRFFCVLNDRAEGVEKPMTLG
jgi:hypothetical protein